MLRGHLLSLWFVLALVLTAGAPLATAAQEASPAASPAALPPLLEEWLAAFNAGDTDRLLTLFTDDGLWEEPAIGLAARGPGRDPGPSGAALHGRAGHWLCGDEQRRGRRWSGSGVGRHRHLQCRFPRTSPRRRPTLLVPGGLGLRDGRTGRSSATPSTGTPTPSWCSSGRCQPRRRPARRRGNSQGVLLRGFKSWLDAGRCVRKAVRGIAVHRRGRGLTAVVPGVELACAPAAAAAREQTQAKRGRTKVSCPRRPSPGSPATRRGERWSRAERVWPQRCSARRSRAPRVRRTRPQGRAPRPCRPSHPTSSSPWTDRC